MELTEWRANLQDQFQELVRSVLTEQSLSVREFAAKLNCPAQSIAPTLPGMWTSGRQVPGVVTLLILARWGETDIAREFGRRGLAIYGLRVID
jgi:hypothetical protein